MMPIFSPLRSASVFAGWSLRDRHDIAGAAQVVDEGLDLLPFRRHQDAVAVGADDGIHTAGPSSLPAPLLAALEIGDRHIQSLLAIESLGLRDIGRGVAGDGPQPSRVERW